MKSETYRSCHCDAECCHESDADTCWGEVQIEADMGSEGYIHTCRGHQWIWSSVYFKDYVAEGEVWPPPRPS